MTTIKPRIYFDLKTLKGGRFYLVKGNYEHNVEMLERFLETEPELRTRHFAKKVMFTHEIEANNRVEGYGDGIEEIKRVIENAEAIEDPEKRARILNLYRAYNYILSHRKIDKESLRELYSIISRDALDNYAKNNMGNYYRKEKVYILRHGNLSETPDEGLPAEVIDSFLESYFKFLNEKLNGSETEEYIKSQILHFYFVYVHPYFDVNGRTSRTLAMWYLLNKKAYAYIIFNRGIAYKGNSYDDTIARAKTTHDLTPFINMMLETVRVELEKEYVLERIVNQATGKLDATDYQTILYFLSMKGLKTVIDFTKMYNRNTNLDHKRVKEVYETMIVPLLDKGVLDIAGETKKDLYSCGPKNKILTLRPLELDPEKTRDLQI